MSEWEIYYTEGTVQTIKADSVSVAGTVVAFLKHAKIAAADGKIQGIPIAFVDLSNMNIQSVLMVEDKREDATVVALV